MRALLRRPDLRSRRDALARLAGWGTLPDSPEVAAMVLRAATASYPWVSGERTDPGEVLARTLWDRPGVLSVTEIEGAYLIAGDRVRRSLLHLLARRHDDGGIDSLIHLLSGDGPTDLLPLPTTWLLDPVLDHPGAGRLVGELARVVSRRGWAWHASDLIRRLVLQGRVDDAGRSEVVPIIGSFLEQLVDACDRQFLGRDGGPDRVRSDRHRVVAVIRLVEVLPGAGAQRLLMRALSSADPRVASSAALALVGRGAGLAPERPALLARDPEARSVLCEGLERMDRLDLLGPPGSEGRTGPSRAEAALVTWLAAETELGRAPDELEHLLSVRATDGGSAPGDTGPGVHPDLFHHLFRFRMRSPHWSCARGWMVGLAGPYREDGTVPEGVTPVAHSLYDAEDEDVAVGHLRSILSSLAAWPEDPDLHGP